MPSMASQRGVSCAGPAILGRALTRPRSNASQAGVFALRRQAD
jgi:hypothetical protein